MLITEEALERLLAKIDTSKSGCHEWLATKNNKGYGQFTNKGKKYLPHRIILELKQPGFLESGLLACHTCDNPACCNPDHLFPGTHKQNTQDMISKKRDLPNRRLTSKRMRGNRQAKTTLTENEVTQIRQLRLQGFTQREIGEVFQTSQTNISAILRGKTWGWLKSGAISITRGHK